jgi:hypothetical protein
VKLPSVMNNRTQKPKKRTPESSLQQTAFQLLLNVMDLVVDSCKSALHSSDLDEIERHLKHAKRHYAQVLRHAARLSFTTRGVAEFESRSILLEAVISKLEARYRMSGNHEASAPN